MENTYKEYTIVQVLNGIVFGISCGKVSHYYKDETLRQLNAQNTVRGLYFKAIETKETKLECIVSPFAGLCFN